VPRKLRLGVAERMAATVKCLPLDEAACSEAAARFRAEGIRAVAVAFLHAYASPAHEQQAARILGRCRRACRCRAKSRPKCARVRTLFHHGGHAYVQPIVDAYLRRLETRRKWALPRPLYLMLSSGGLTTVDIAARFPVRLVESGPAGGAIFAASVAAECGAGKFWLDVGGTTAKICLINQFRPQTSQVFEVGRAHRFRKGSGLPLRIPVVEMVEIGAGGGSIASVDRAGRLAVWAAFGRIGGPAAYGRGGTRDRDRCRYRARPDRSGALCRRQGLARSHGVGHGARGPGHLGRGCHHARRGCERDRGRNHGQRRASTLWSRA
jgi:N-methylhydantoinase A